MAQTNSAQDLVNNILQYRYNAAAIQRTAVQLVSDVSNGDLVVVDPTNPFLYTMEAGACMTAAFMIEHEAECRRRYPLLALTQEDLYLHMSDQDYIGRFATPAQPIVFTLRFPKEQLIAAMLPEPATGYIKVTIPRNTYFTVGNLAFSLQYPIDIRQLSHGGLQITYDNSVISPLQTLTTNSIEYTTVTQTTGDYVQFNVDTFQFSILTQLGTISLTKELVMQIPFTDQFYFARVYFQDSVTGKWNEMDTTHAPDVYNITSPTAVLNVDTDNSLLTVSIPQIYINNGTLRTKIRVDLYQTKGAINVNLGDYGMNSFSITWKTYDSTEVKSPYFAAITNLNTVVTSNENVIDGQNALSFDALRNNVIQNTTGPIDDSITPAQIQTSLVDKGYEVAINVDNVTNRVFLATRAMPTPTVVTPTTAATVSTQLLTAAAASIETLSVTTQSLALLPTVIDNGTSITITPDTLYQIVDGITSPLAQADVEALKALPADQQALQVTNGNYLYTPFHYVLDSTNGAFEIRPYYLDSPVATSKAFEDHNDTTLIQVATGIYGLVRTTTGYLMQIVTSSDSTFQSIPDNQVFVQLAFIPPGERDRAYVNGVLAGRTSTGERFFNFDLSSTLNVDSDDNLELTKFTMYNTEPRICKTPLTFNFDIIYSTSQVMTALWVADDIDQILGRQLLPQQIAGITHETLSLNFGSSLDMLWTRARTVASSMTYQTWPADVPAVYATDIYLRDENGSSYTIVNGQLTQTLLHKAGDPVLDPATGAPTFSHKAGDVVLDSTGAAVPASPRGLLRQIDLLLIEGVYWFATDPTTTNYRQVLTQTLVSWLNNDLASFTGRLLDQTRIYFYPKTTSGVVDVIVGDNLSKTILAGQSFTVTLAVTKQVFDNANLRDRLQQTTVATIADQLTNQTVSMSQINKALSDAYGDDVVDVETTGLGGTGNNYSVVTLVNPTDRLSIRKQLTAQADNTLVAEEAVTCIFVIHDASNLNS